jgi:S-DNA-T family DNA segregation ATPase FtsK/SpoIIIE
MVGQWLNYALTLGFGALRYIFPVYVLGLVFLLYEEKRHNIPLRSWLGSMLVVLALHGLFHNFIPMDDAYVAAAMGTGGGYLGYGIAYAMQQAFGFAASLLFYITFIVVGILLAFDITLRDLQSLLGLRLSLPGKRDEYEDIYEEEPVFEQKILGESAPSGDETEVHQLDLDEAIEEAQVAQTVASETKPGPEPVSGGGDITDSDADFSIPIVRYDQKKIDLPVKLLSPQKSKPSGGDLKAGALRIKKTLDDFGVPVQMGEVMVGPTVTQYTLKPASGVRLSKISQLHDNLALSLAAHPIRIEAPIPGKPMVGIEVPNKQVATVSMREMLESTEFKKRKSNMMMCLGRDVSGKPWLVDLTKMPHLLVAGATGSGKSVCLNTIIVSLLYQNTPETLRLIMVDPKRVEFPGYNGIPHLLTPVITDVNKTVNALKWTIGEMNRRFDVLSKAGKREIKSYNETADEKIPYLVFIIDELADLMIAASKEIEVSIIRIAQMARAVGIHLILATQRPSVDVLTGLIKANVPSRIAFSVASIQDSRTILDSAGAEKLIGRGDMLFQTAELAGARRIQGAYLSDEEIKKVVRYLKDALELPVEYNDDIIATPKGGSSIDIMGGGADGDDMGDSMYEDAKNEVIRSKKASASYLQRRLRVGYSRAARLIDLLEENGIIGPANGSKPREVLIQDNDIEGDLVE